MERDDAFLGGPRLAGWWALDGWSPPAGLTAHVLTIDKAFSGEGFDRYEHTFARDLLTDLTGATSQHAVELLGPVVDDDETLDNLRTRIGAMSGVDLAEIPDGGYHRDADGYAISHLDLQLAAALCRHMDAIDLNDDAASARRHGVCARQGDSPSELRAEYQGRTVRAERDAEARSVGARMTAAKRQQDRQRAMGHVLESAADRLAEPLPPGRRGL